MEEERQDITWLNSTNLSFIKSREVEGGYAGLFTASSDRYILNTPDDSVCSACISWFLSDQGVFVDRPRHLAALRAYEIQTPEGKKIAGGSLTSTAFDLSSSATSDRLAFLQWHYIGAGFFYVTRSPSIVGKVTVLDWKKNRHVADIEFSEPTENPSAGYNESALAMSPDGKRVAVLLHHTLACYELPDR